MDLLKRLAAPAALLLLIACGGGSKASVQNLASTPQPRPAIATLNLQMEDQTNGTVTRQLFLDPGSGTYQRQYPVVVGNDQELQGVKLWRYDFIDPTAATSPATAFYATLLVRVDDTTTAQTLSFWGRGGSYPALPYTLNPNSLFGGTPVPETPANLKNAAVFLFIRQGNPVRLVDPTVIGKVGPYRDLTSMTVLTTIPGLDFPVGGAQLSTGDATPVIANVGNVNQIIDQVTDPNSPSSGITTPATTVDNERVPTTTRVSPATSEYDLLFAWQPPEMGVTITHGVTADPTIAGEPFASGSASFTGGGFFLTTQPGSPSVVNGRNLLDWTVLQTSTDSQWILGFTAEVSATGSIVAGQQGTSLSDKLPGSGTTNGQVRGYLAGAMSPYARVTQFQGAQDKNIPGYGPAVLYSGTKIPLLARNTRSPIQAKLGQLTIGGRTLWYRQNSTLLGADVLNSDQTLVDRYGTTMSFSAYLPVPASGQ